MNDLAPSTIIAERHFESRNEAGEEHEIIVRIGIPVHDPCPDGDWYCPYQITGFPNSRVSVAFGIDSLQALLLALGKVHADLVFCQRVNRLHLTWLEQDNLGFP